MNNQYRQIKRKQLSKKRSISVQREINSNISSIKKIIENKKVNYFRILIFLKINLP